MDDVYYMRSIASVADRRHSPVLKTKTLNPTTISDISNLLTVKNKIKESKFESIKRFPLWTKKLFEDFCNETTIHGFNHIVAPKRHLLEKIGWAVATILAALGAVQLCRQQWQRYVENPTVLSLEKDYRTWNNTFPAISACMENKVIQTEAVKLIESLWNVKEGDKMFHYYMKFVEVVANATMNNLIQFEAYENDTSLNKVNLFDITVKVATSYNVTSNWFDRNLNFPFVKVMTDFGVCYTLNSVVSKDQAIQKELVPTPDKVSRSQPIACEYVTHPCYTKMEANFVCVKYYVHSPYEILDISTNMVTKSCPSQDYTTDWKVIETKSSEDVKALTVVQRNCRYHNEPINKKQEVYSPGICRRGCRNAAALKLCGCRPYFYFQENGPLCNVSGMACLSKYKKEFEGSSSCTCLPQCIDATYELAYIKEDIWKGPFATRCAIRVLILPPRSRYRRQILFNFEDLIVSFGGAAGLFLGCSFLSGVEIVYFVLERIGSGLVKLCCWRRKKSKKVEETKNKENSRRVKFSTDQISDVEKNGERYAMKNYFNTIAQYE